MQIDVVLPLQILDYEEQRWMVMVKQGELRMCVVMCSNMFKGIDEYVELVKVIYFHSWALCWPIKIQSWMLKGSDP